MSRNLASLLAVWSRNVWSTTKPLVATRRAGRSACPSESVPHLRSAFCQVRGVPGTPTDSPLVTASLNGMPR